MSTITANNKIIVVLGPTSSGKTKLGVWLARQFNGEIVSADSRQVYKGMDVGTGKDLKDYRLQFSNHKKNLKSKFPKEKNINIPYHLIDVVSPRSEFNLAKYQKLAFKAINQILARGRLPIIVGGSGLYLQAIVDGYQLRPVKPDQRLRKKLEQLTPDQLLAMLNKQDADFASSLNNSERGNKRRLIRYLEIRKQPRESSQEKAAKRNYNFLLIGLVWPKQTLNQRIKQRLMERLEREDMIGEVKRLRAEGLSWRRLEDLGLEYKYLAWYLRGKIDYQQLAEKLNIAIRQFAKRQLTWFRRWQKQGARIHWLTDQRQAATLVKKFLK